MLLVLALILFAIWVIGLLVKVTFWFIHLAIIGAVILFILHFLRRSGGTTAV